MNSFATRLARVTLAAAAVLTPVAAVTTTVASPAIAQPSFYGPPPGVNPWNGEHREPWAGPPPWDSPPPPRLYFPPVQQPPLY